MSGLAQILVIEDDPAFNAMVCERLVERGYDVTSVARIPDALQALDRSRVDVILLDIKLDGPDGADVGIDALGKVLDRAPATKVILMTAYADPSSVERAFESGAYDYVEKTDFRVFDALLQAKIRNALEPAREARITSLVNGEREQELKDLWGRVQTETQRSRKGPLLEELLLILWRSMPGFAETHANVRTRSEEIDLVVINKSSDLFWQKEGALFLIECKNWQGRVDRKEVDVLVAKMRRRGGRCRLAFLVAPSGVTKAADEAIRSAREQGNHIALLPKERLDTLVHVGSPAARLQALQSFVINES